MSTPDQWMALAERLAEAQQRRTGLNPAVGCVIVKNGVVIGLGATADGGRPHAEALALAQAGEAARGADVYVTLEPCAHFGQTPPCANRLVEAQVARIFCPWRDPDTRTSGKSFTILETAGIVVERMSRPMNEGLRAFMVNKTLGRPFVALKLATSLDGKIALQNGESQWISSARARRYTNLLRAKYQAIGVGIGTALSDDPRLDVRFADLPNPRPVVFDRTARLPKDACLLGGPSPIIVTSEENREAEWQGANTLAVPVVENLLDLKYALKALYKDMSVSSILIEGGAALAASFQRDGLIDRIYHMATGAVMGGDAISAMGSMGIDNISSVPRFDCRERISLGDDTLLVYERDFDFGDLSANSRAR